MVKSSASIASKALCLAKPHSSSLCTFTTCLAAVTAAALTTAAYGLPSGFAAFAVVPLDATQEAGQGKLRGRAVLTLADLDGKLEELRWELRNATADAQRRQEELYQAVLQERSEVLQALAREQARTAEALDRDRARRGGETLQLGRALHNLSVAQQAEVKDILLEQLETLQGLKRGRGVGSRGERERGVNALVGEGLWGLFASSVSAESDPWAEGGSAQAANHSSHGQS